MTGDAHLENQRELAALDAVKVGDRVAVEHDCEGLAPGSTVRHSTPVLVTWVNREAVMGIYYRGVRCDGTRIEWIEGRS